MRKIIHIDMDAFYAAVEQRDSPELRGLPLAVGSGQGRGVVLTASYEARPYGVRSAMPSRRALQLCPDLLFVPPRFAVYKRESARIREILTRYTDLIEPVSLDEAYLDVTTPRGGPAPAVTVARSIKAAIRETTGLTASAGVSFNKFLAKIASDLHKPDGLTVIRPEQALAFLADLPIERFHGVGPATARRMRGLGIASGADLQGRSEHELTAAFGRLGHHYWRMARAEDDRAVEPNRPRLSVSVETTFENDMRSDSQLQAALLPLAQELALRVERTGFQGRTLNLKVRFGNFRIATRRMTRTTAFRDPDDILRHARELLAQRPRREAAVRLLGIGVSSEAAGGDSRQLALQLTETDGAQR